MVAGHKAFLNVKMDGWTNGWMDGQTDGEILEEGWR